MATLATVMDNIADQLTHVFSSVTDIERIGIHIEGRAFSAAEMPAIDMLPVAPGLLRDRLGGFGDLVDSGWSLNIRVRVSPADLYAGEDLLLAFMDDEDPLSIIKALDYDHSLGGVASDIAWGDWLGYMPFPSPTGDGELLGSRLPLLVIKASS